MTTTQPTPQQANERMLFVNLPVADPAATRAFWSELGFTVNEAFSDDRAVSVQLNALTSVMFLEHAYFHSFHGTTAPASGTGALYCLSAGSADDVRALVERALALGGSPAGEPQDDGPMFGWSFRDPEGQIWEVMWMDPAALG
ncbi:VOC family protein [Nocardioides zeae]|uniref:Lactoylglutathione lyase n=1 Tax=Nocardioides zeae TaxID=1457234 RepID=A0AAJ1U0Z9_9ACTN|nr:VOC family protein [Nocardioides zeae]MDQ1105991.1 putative lactoylglutathione lyase [Nocardioides zeae]